MAEQHSFSENYTNPYKFNGKELDTETGLYYYSARYYDPRISVWLSVDPLLEKYPNFNLYVYCYQNPINLIDPDGREAGDPKKSGYYKATVNTRTIGFIKRYPLAALSIGTYSKGSTNISTNSVRFSTRIGLIENESKEGSQVNAFRHTLLQAEITQEFGSSIAKQAGNAHEENSLAVSKNNLKNDFNSLIKADETADLLNNIIGRSIGEANPNATMQEIALKVLDYYKKEGLWEAKKGEGLINYWTVSQNKLSDEQYNHAKNIIQNLNPSGFTPKEQQARDINTKKEIKRYDTGPKW